MTETTFYILLSLIEPLHGYAVMQKVKELSEGTVTIGAGTLYGAFSKLNSDQLIEFVKSDDRRKFYQLTDKGFDVLLAHISKLAIMVDKGQKILSEGKKK
jgi:DNA-binding PadR family transcriptional regulator